MNQSLHQLRFFEEGDYPMVVAWWQAHKAPVPPHAVLPKLGVVCLQGSEPVGALWLYMDNSVGVCFAEHLVTRPGMSLLQSRKAAGLMIRYLKQTAASFGYAMMRVVTIPALARFMRQEGFSSERTGVVTMLAPLQKGES